MPQPQPTTPRGCLGPIFKLLKPLLQADSECPRSRIPLPYKRQQYLITKAERAFLHVLEDCIPPNTRIFCQIRLADLLYIPKGTEQKTRQSAQGRINQRYVDFVLVDSDQLRPLLVIELNDQSHQRQDRQQRDAFVKQALKAAGLPLLPVRAARSYVSSTLREHIVRAISDPI